MAKSTGMFEIFKRVRERRGLTQRAMAQLLGMKKSNYGKKELGDVSIKDTDLEKLAEVEGVTVSELFKKYRLDTSTDEQSGRAGISAWDADDLNLAAQALDELQAVARHNSRVSTDSLSNFRDQVESFPSYKNPKLCAGKPKDELAHKIICQFAEIAQSPEIIMYLIRDERFKELYRLIKLYHDGVSC